MSEGLLNDEYQPKLGRITPTKLDKKQNPYEQGIL